MISVALGNSEQTRMSIDSSPTDSGPRREPGGSPHSPPASLCHSCSFVRVVGGRRGQRYLLCRNETIPAKYPSQPVFACTGYERGTSAVRL